jgi:hypothetical protein
MLCGELPDAAAFPNDHLIGLHEEVAIENPNSRRPFPAGHHNGKVIVDHRSVRLNQRASFLLRKVILMANQNERQLLGKVS